MAMRLYNLLPFIIRVRDALASGSLEGEQTTEGVLAKLVSCFEEELGVVEEEIRNLTDLVDIDSCPERFLPFLASLVGGEFSASWSLEKKRNVLKAIGALIKIKACQRSWRAILNWRGYQGYFPWEMCKSRMYEDFDYAPLEEGTELCSYHYPYKSTRIELSTGEYNPLPYKTTKSLLEFLDWVRPIHVLLKPRGIVRDLTDTFPLAEDSFDFNVLGGEEEPSEEPEPGVERSWYDTVSTPNDGRVYIPEITGESCEAVGLEIIVTCEHSCQLACQAGCTHSCETGCQTGPCELACQLFCQLHCQLDCEFDCMTACEDTCEDACMSFPCQTGAEDTTWPPDFGEPGI